MKPSQSDRLLSKAAILEILRKGAIDLQGQFTLGSNYTFLVSLQHAESSLQAVYKPRQGEMPLWDFPVESLAAREVAAYLISEALGWELVPPTIIRDGGPFGQGSLQLYIPHNPERNYFSFNPRTIQRLKPTALFDLILNNADRKGSHVIQDQDGHIWLIDHGLCFHPLPKLRTVIWDFAGQAIPAELIASLENLLPNLRSSAQLRKDLSRLLGREELAALKSRIMHIIKQPVFPKPEPQKRQFPWPLV